MKLILTTTLCLSVLFAACTTKSVRTPASLNDCDDFNSLSSVAKAEFFELRELESAASFLNQPATGQLESDLHGGGQATLSYVASFIGGLTRETAYSADALAATSRFLAPPVAGATGYPTLKPTLTRACDILESPRVKMVHAIGTMASAHLVVYPKLKALNSGEVVAEELSPWTGLFDPSVRKNIPLLMRFSIANPVAHSLQIDGKSLSLEFIPGLGLKFLIDGQKSIDLLAMESLAGQKNDHNYFKYEFSPDFSAHAPEKFNTATGQDKAEISERYAFNPLNRTVMGWVGERFFQVLPMVYNIKLDQVDTHSLSGPNPFIISIQKMASYESSGHTVAHPKRPWRLVFVPALDNIDEQRLSEITDSSPRTLVSKKSDFRYKLAHLRSGDRAYYVVGETETGRRYKIGEIIMDSSPIPTEFADKEFFIQHEIEMDRLTGNSSVVEPEVSLSGF